MTSFEHLDAMNSLIKDINSVLYKHGIDQEIHFSDINITDNTVSDLVKPDAKLSYAITNHLWPSVKSASVYHFTTRDAAESILNNNSFRLSNIAKRYSEGEIETFCKTHDLQGYLVSDLNGDPKYKHLLMPNTYYASFTDATLTDEQEQYFWSNFATCDGVRLKIDVSAANPNFRKMFYEQKSGVPIAVLAELVQSVRENHNREFILKGISRLCSFYLSGEDYGIENEYRALYRVWEGFGPQPKGLGENSYIELPLGTMSESGYQLEITEVHAIDKPNMPDSYVFSKRSA